MLNEVEKFVRLADADVAPAPEIALSGARPAIEGKFLTVNGARFWVKGVTYGTFAPNSLGEPFPEIEQIRDDFALGINGLDNTHPSIVQIRCVVVVSDLALRFARADFELCRSKVLDSFIDRFGRVLANRIDVLEIAGMATTSVWKCITIRRAVCVGGTDQDVRGWYSRH